MYLLVVSMVDDVVAPKPPSQVVMETCGSDISCSGRVSVLVRAVFPELRLFLGPPVRVT